jgi:hypothetical protein
MRLLQRRNTPLHHFPAHTDHLDFRLRHLLHLAHGADVRHGTLIRSELACPGCLEASVGVLTTRVGAGAGGEEEVFARLQGRGRDAE